MANYDLNVVFTTEQLQAIYATGSHLVMAKSIAGQNPNVAWQAFNPFQSNQISWNEEYGIYCSTVNIVNGAQINQLSATPTGVDTNTLYTLESNGVIFGPTTGGQPDTFALQNNYSNNPYMTIGLFQSALINGVEINGNAISATPVLLQSLAYMNPSTNIYIWLQSQIESNSVITRITSPVSILKYGNGINALSVQYDSNTGIFINTSSSD